MARLNSQQPIAEVRDVTYRYQDRPILSGLSLQVMPGRIYGLLGPNGAGKSTTMKLLVGLLQPQTGSVNLFGEPFTRKALKRVGATIDGPALYGHLSARQNLNIHAALIGVSKNRVSEILHTVGLSNTGRLKTTKFSTGMKARLALAIALLGNPDLLILDEPQNGLDPEGVRELRSLLGTYVSTGRSVLISSHVLGEVENIVDDVGILRNGKLLVQGPLENLASKGQLEDAYFSILENKGQHQ